VADAAVELRRRRNQLKAKHGLSFRELYRSLELPGDHPLKTVHAALDQAVRSAYGMRDADDTLAFLLNLNSQVSQAEHEGGRVQGPGPPKGNC
jgi:hypothetical protein